MSLQKAIHNYLIANRYFFKVNIANFHSNYITLRKLYSKFARYKLLKLNIMKIIMVGMVAFVVCKYQAQKKNTKLEVKTNITTVKDSDGNKQVIQTKEVEEVQSINLKMLILNLNKDIKKLR
jgi:hypothetical protein